MNILQKAQALLEDYDLDGLVVDSSFNRRYLTGFTGTFGAVFITKTSAVFITDFRYTEQAKAQTKDFEVVENRNVIQEVARQLKTNSNIKRLGFEGEHVSFNHYQKLAKEWDVELVPLSGFVERLREIKTDGEIENIKTAAMIADKSFQKILEDIQPGVSEKEIKNHLEMYMREAGATSSGFDMIIASGYRSAMPHGVASDKIIEKGDMVTLDFGALYEGYCSDMTRTVAVGEPAKELKEIYAIVYDALELGIKAIKSGVTCKYVDTVVRDFIASKGYGENFGHGTGHSFGLEIHEAPYFSQKSDEILTSGMVMTVEPGIYIPGVGGVRIEDDVLVTEAGCEILTNSAKELIIL